MTGARQLEVTEAGDRDAPGLTAASILTFRIAWNAFIVALVLTDRKTRTLPVAASMFITDIGVEWGKFEARRGRSSPA